MEVFFKPIQTEKIYLKIVDQIIQLIKEGRFKPGDKLPPERTIAEQMGISRPVLREAVAALEVIGVLETKPGHGTFVISGDFEGLKSRAHAAFQGERSPSEVMEVRKPIESYAAALAAERATHEQIEGIGRALEVLCDTVTENQEWNDAADIQFHEALARASGNSVLEDVCRILSDMCQQKVLARLRELDHLVPGKLEKSLDEHRQIYEPITARDPDAAQNAVWQHFINVERDLFDV